MRSRIEIMGSIVPATPLPHYLLHPEGHDPMAQDVPGAGGESRSPRQGVTLLDRRVRHNSSREVFRTHLVVYECRERGFWGGGAVSVVVDPPVLEFTAIHNLLDPQCEWDHSLAGPGCHGEVTELARFITIGGSHLSEHGCFSLGNSPEKAWREIATQWTR